MLMKTFTVFDPTKLEPRVGAPAGWTVVGGKPVAQAWRCYTSDDGKRLSGMWTCSRGTFDVVYDKWEFCHLISGSCKITPEGGEPTIVKAGDAFILEKTFKGSWEVLEACTKHFVFVAD
jgi:uncharacterized cupin superfamily protein